MSTVLAYHCYYINFGSGKVNFRAQEMQAVGVRETGTAVLPYRQPTTIMGHLLGLLLSYVVCQKTEVVGCHDYKWIIDSN